MLVFFKCKKNGFHYSKWSCFCVMGIKRFSRFPMCVYQPWEGERKLAGTSANHFEAPQASPQRPDVLPDSFGESLHAQHYQRQHAVMPVCIREALEKTCRKGFPTTRSLMDCLKGISDITIYQEMWRCVTRRFIISLPLVTWKVMKWGNCEGLRNTA